MEQKPLKIKVSLSLDEDLVRRAKKLAEEDDRSLSQFVNLILRNYLNTAKDEK